AATCALLLGLGWVPTGRAAPATLQDDEEFPGVDGETYESPTWGYTLEGDERDWTVVGASSEDDRDQLHLGSEASDLVIVGVSFDDDLETCREDLIDTLAPDGAAEPFEADQG